MIGVDIAIAPGAQHRVQIGIDLLAVLRIAGAQQRQYIQQSRQAGDRDVALAECLAQFLEPRFKCRHRMILVALQ